MAFLLDKKPIMLYNYNKVFIFNIMYFMELTKKQIYGKKRYLENREKLLAYANKWHLENREKANTRKATKRREQSQKEMRPYYKRGEYITLNNLDLKIKVLKIYGNKCQCCGEIEPIFLTIDHINNDGHKERAKCGARLRGRPFYLKLLKGEKRNDIQILCFNCNIGRQNNKGICPHKR